MDNHIKGNIVKFIKNSTYKDIGDDYDILIWEMFYT